MAVSEIPRLLDFNDIKVFKTDNAGATAATLKFSGTSRYVALISTMRPATDGQGLYAVHGYGATVIVTPLKTSALVTISNTTNGVSIAASANVAITVVVLWDANDSASFSYS